MNSKHSWLPVVVALVLGLPLVAQAAQTEPADSQWLSRSQGTFRYVYQAADQAYVDRLAGLQDRVCRTVQGYLGYLPAGTVTVVVRGNNSALGWGGYFAPFPLRIVLNPAAAMDPFELFVHEFTHYTQASIPAGPVDGLAWIFGKDLRAANLPLAPHSLEGSTSFMDGSRFTPLGLLPAKALLHAEKPWAWEDFWWSGWEYPGALRVYAGGALFQEALYEQFGPGTFSEIWQAQAGQLLDEEAAICQVTGLDPRVIWQRKLQALRARWAADFARPDGQAFILPDTRRQFQVSAARTIGRGRLLVLGAGTAEPWGFRILDRDGQVQPVAGGLDGGTRLAIRASSDWSVSADGSFLVQCVADPAVSSLDTEALRTWLEWYQLDASGGVLGTGRLAVRSGGRRLDIMNPALSPDGRRLVLVSRQSDSFTLGEVDLQTGAFTPIPRLPQCIGASWSPDGTRLALTLLNGGDTDVGLLYADGWFRQLAHDPASDFAPVFGPDGELLFASDRQDRIAIYRYRDEDGAVFPWLDDPVGAWAPLFPDGSSTGLVVYRSVGAEGHGLKTRTPAQLAATAGAGPIPDFFGLRPGSLASQEQRLGAYAAASRIAASEAPEAPQAGPVATFVDGPDSAVWYPQASWDTRGLGFGIDLQAFSILGSTGLALQLMGYPEYGQAAGKLDLAFHQPGFDAQVSTGYDWGQSDRSAASQGHYAAWLGLSGSLVWGTWQDAQGTGTIASSLGAWWTTSRESSGALALPDLFTVAWSDDWQVSGGIGWSWQAPAAESAFFGSNRFSLNLQGLGVFDTLSTGLAAGVDSSLGIDLGGGVLAVLSPELAIARDTDPFGLIHPWAAAWANPANAALAWRTEAELRLPLGLYAGSLAGIPTDRGGLSLGLATQFFSTDWSALEWQPRLEFMLWYTEGFRYLYQSLPLRLQLGYRLDLSDLDQWPVFDVSNLCFGLSLANVDLLGARPTRVGP